MTETPYRLFKQDAVEFLQGIPAGSANLIITDPAYESMEKHRKIGTTTRLKKSNASSNEWFKIFPNTRYPEFFSVCFTALAKNSHLYVMCDDETAYIIKPIAEAAGFKYWKRIVWDKEKIGMGYHYRARCEYILFFEKGKRKLHDLGMPDVFDFKEDAEGYVLSCARVANGYPTEKPVEVSKKLIAQSSLPGELVVDPFMGSASVGEAALSLGRRFWGSDIADLSHVTAEARLSALLPENREQLEWTK
jgi:site-specific DNA-methyltransferase (adenine-specific)